MSCTENSRVVMEVRRAGEGGGDTKSRVGQPLYNQQGDQWEPWEIGKGNEERERKVRR